MLNLRARAVSGLAAAAALLALAGCAAEGARATGPLRVVATTAILGEFARDVAGADAVVTTLIPPGADPHSFEASTQVARDVAAADVIIVNGYHLEGGLLEVIAANRRRVAHIVVAARGLAPLTPVDEPGSTAAAGALPAPATDLGDPHMWLDPELAARFVENIGSGLSEADPSYADGYRERGRARAAGLRALRAELATSLSAIPAERRRIVVFHDAFAYFARAFDFRLAAGILPEQGGREPSARALADTVALVREQAVPAIYSEPQFSAAILEAISRETGARVLVLYSDAYGAGVNSYDEMMQANAAALLDGLGAPGAR